MDLKQMNKTTAATTSIGAAVAVVLIFIAQKTGLEMSPVDASVLTGAFAFLVNWFIPSKK